MHALRLLRRPFGSTVYNLRPLTRWQHGNHGPHKEYFQHPSQYPIDGLPISQPHASQPTLNIPTPPLPPPPQAQQPSLIRQTIQATLLTILFFAVGFSVGTGVITWEYLQPPYEPGSEEDLELIEDIKDLVETHPMIASLQEQGWVEDKITPTAGKGRHLVSDALSGVQGISLVKHFRPPSGPFSMTVFFAGFGIERQPELVHAGALTTMIEEAIEYNIKQFPEFHVLVQPQVDTQFMHMVSPGQMYALLVIPEGLEAMVQNGVTVVLSKSLTMLLSGDHVPQVQPAPVESGPDGGRARLNIFIGENTLHATSVSTSILELVNFMPFENESREAFDERRTQEILRLSKKKHIPYLTPPSELSPNNP